MLLSCTQHPQRKKFRVFNVKILPNSHLCWNSFTHAQLLNIRILVKFLHFWYSLFQFLQVFANSYELNATLTILPILCILMRLADGDSPCCARVVFTWERNFEVTFGIFSVLIFQINVLESYLDICLFLN